MGNNVNVDTIYDELDYENEANVDTEVTDDKHHGGRSTQYYRKQRAKHIKRKLRIIKSHDDYWYVKHVGMLSKGKIHCSCPMCSAKRKTHGMKYSDIRRIPVQDVDD